MQIKIRMNWAGKDGDLCTYIESESRKTLDAYAKQPNLVIEHANLEHDTARGGYAHRQLFELVQNGADALGGASGGGRIAVRLTERCLYCADDGAPIDRAGATALMSSHMSPKRGTSEIGRFGLGFKSVLGVTDAPEFFSRAGSFRFDRRRALERINEVVPDAVRCPVLRVAEPVDQRIARDRDPVLAEFMDWATNIVRLPLEPDKASDIRRQMGDFPPEFLLFVEHVRQLRISDGLTLDRVVELEKSGEQCQLIDGGVSSSWRLFKVVHRLSSDARADRRSLDDGDEVPISWAVPLERLTEPGVFWAYFPTKTASLVAGILNAPWKTNEDRQNLLPGPYNDELIDAAAAMIVDELPGLSTHADPARHLDALPRRHEAGDSEQVERLRDSLFAGLCDREVIPDQDGVHRLIPDVHYPPDRLTSAGAAGAKALEQWARYPGRPRDWLHQRAVPRTRFARVEHLIEAWNLVNRYSLGPRAALVWSWLEALVDGKTGDAAIAASRAALVTALAIPHDLRGRGHRPGDLLGRIVLVQNGSWSLVDPERVFLPRDVADPGPPLNAGKLVHEGLAGDADARRALEELGIGVESAESHLKHVVSQLSGYAAEDLPSDDTWWRHFWTLTRDVEPRRAEALITSQSTQAGALWRRRLRVLSQGGAWQPLDRVLLPGGIVPGADLRDRHAAVDLEFHEADEELLERLGVVSEPAGRRELSDESWFDLFRKQCRHRFKDRDLPRQPFEHLLNFESTIGAGPLDVLAALSEEGRADYTHALLVLDSTYGSWVMRHDSQAQYPKYTIRSPAVVLLRQYGRVRTAAGIVPFADALGQQPKDPQARDVLLEHPCADRIKEVFGLAEPTPEFLGEEDPVPLSDVWPGFLPVLKDLGVDLSIIEDRAHLVRCEQILVGGDANECLVHASDIYLCRADDERHELRSVLRCVPGLADEPDIRLWEIVEFILQYTPPPNVEAQRASVRKFETDTERLLEAVGEQALRRGLPWSLLVILENDTARLSGVAVAEAAIATYHSGALRQYRHALAHLDPPRQWAGSRHAVDFVRSLGFSEEWAGERNVRRAPFMEVEGPYRLPPLHHYQEKIVSNVRHMLRGAILRGESANGGGRRGMISLPTGSGKTRVAVQAIVEAMRGDRFGGCVLWVADRDELCEQAVEAWGQVWSAIGPQRMRLHVSRMWAGQPAPVPTSDFHVVVATIQTLAARLRHRRSEYDFLTDSALVVFDEAHRSIAPTFTSVMQEIGLTRRQHADEPFLIGLTATPYRGHDAEETARLVNRYGSWRLDAGAFASDDPEDVVSELQRMQVLALADHETIDGGRFSLNAEELAEMSGEPRPPWLPRSVEERIARDSVRTSRIVEAYEREIRGVDADCPTLVFATSVEHAQTIAALLSARGVRSRAVSGATEPATRRRIVEGFRRGDVKVLVNYGVVQEGFDAPKTRAIIVARPVYSPNLYFQMVGRGLRGPRNGGTDRCLIINVQDNIDNFERRLAFSELDWLWA